MIPVALAGAGALTGLGAALMVAGLLPTTPDLRTALAQLEGQPAKHPEGSRWQAWSSAQTPRLAATLGVARHRADLDLIGDTPEHLVLRKVGFGFIGLAFPPVLATTMSLIGLTLPLVIPGVAALGLAALLFLAPDVDVRRRADAARKEMRRAICVYLELVALERVADAGSTEALHRAAQIGDGRAFSMIRDALLKAQLAGLPPWQGLAQLADETRVPELGDVADIMRVSGEGIRTDVRSSLTRWRSRAPRRD